ncbi:hypothetical protein GCM10011344_47440 [Dokdonia pacifica]|uniref:Uncharacterized protein n=1 Tax=Dokdonia pacifica TaxID=1627892 RepID=A0A239DT98_9FLAO|nr:hypothetical protein [Dokdonia pacifica]GGG41085.1 hypothetical protein GCM10011344_47440 [Dokdonia pacifica]SNS35567.1 hypothetical protein SAMN06265376_11248 [Dokdonia pacifica]
MKKLMNLKGATSLDKAQQKEVNGGLRKLCNGNCSGRPNGSRCYMGGHCSCPGDCISGECIPW